jgi:serine/threonine-protein kinase
MPARACVQCGQSIPEGTRICPHCRALVPVLAASSVTAGSTIERPAGKIVVESRLGAGGMGVVYRAWFFHRPGTARAADPPMPVALKVLKPAPGAAQNAREFFDREAEALRRLSHPNVVRLFDMFEHDGIAMMMIELVDGETIESVIARHVARSKLSPGVLPGIPFQRAWYYFEQLLGALASVHALGIVHRDIKPSNMLIRRDGIVKLGDFGIAKVGEAGGISDPDAVPGTGAYMSPEQVMARPLDGRSDLYSATIVLFEMLAARPPFSITDKTELMVRQEQVHATPPPIRSFLPQAPPALEALLARGLAKDPNARFQSAIEMGDAIRSAMGLPESPGWQAQVELARAATDPSRSQRVATLRDVVAERYKTMPLPITSARKA